jgi:hypothetical protein
MQDTDCGLYVEWHRDQWHTVPLYRQPQPMLTEEERRAIKYFTGFDWTVIRFRVALHGLLIRATTDHANAQRLTASERIALCNARDAYAAISEDDEYYAEIAAAIRGVVERLG